MEGNNDSGLSSYYHHRQQQQQHHFNANTTTSSSLVNGIFSNPQNHNSPSGHFASSEGNSLVFSPHSAPASSGAAPLETVKRKRGRPRKYGTSENQVSAFPSASAKNPSGSHSSPPRKDERSSASTSSSKKKAQLDALGNAGQSFTPHVITVAAGEDVAQKIMSFMQQRKRAICILSASGSISNASLRQPATFGGNVTYEGRFEIISLSGSFLHTEIGGSSSRTGGLSVCLSSTDGRIIGGGVGGPLKAAGPVQVIVGSFVIDAKKDVNISKTIDASASKLPPSVVGATVSSIGFRSKPDSSGNHHQSIGSSFILQSRGMHGIPSRSTDFRSGMDARGGIDFELSGRAGHGGYQSAENGDD